MSKSVTFCLPASNAPRHLPRSSFVAPKTTWPVRTQAVATTTNSSQTTNSSTTPTASQPSTTSVSVLPAKGAYPQTVAVSSSPAHSPSPHTQANFSLRVRGSPSTHATTASYDGNGKGSPVLAHSVESTHLGSKPRVEPSSNHALNLSKLSKMAEQVRTQSNAASHNLVRAAKYEVSRMYEFLIKLEEEIKLTHKARHTLEMAVQDIRKSISLNQQTISSQQKKTRGNEVSSI